jgi:hypothetical protein
MSQVDGKSEGAWQHEYQASTVGGFTVDPQAIPTLCKDLEDIRDRIVIFIHNSGSALMVRETGSDPTSLAAKQKFNDNANAALNAAQRYVDQLHKVISELGQIAQRYQVTEDSNAANLRGAGK